MYNLFVSIQRIIALLILMQVLQACSKTPTSSNNNPTPSPTPVDNSFPVNLVVDSVTLQKIRIEVATNSGLAAAVNSIIMQPALTALSKTPVPAVEANSENFSNISTQSRECRSLALRWLYTFQQSPSEAKPYFDKVVSTLLAWVNFGNKVANPVHTPNETSYYGFYEAYSIVRSRMTAADRNKVDNWIGGRVFAYRTFPPRVNNWETIRLNLLYYFGYLLSDKTLIDATDGAYTTLLNVNLKGGGQSEDVISRDAFAYHAYNLAFYARILRVKYLYEGPTSYSAFKARKNNIGVSLQDLMNYWKPFLIDPANNVHLEFVNTNYAPDKTRSDYNKPYDPASTVYALEELVFGFPESAGYIQKIVPTATRYNRSLMGFLYWP